MKEIKLLITYIYTFFYLLRIYLWSARYPSINKKRVLPSLLAVVISLAPNHYSYIFILTKIGQIIFIIDDLIDDNNIELAELIFLKENPIKKDSTSILPYDYRFQTLISIYLEVSEELKQKVKSVELFNKWEESFIELIDSFIQEKYSKNLDKNDYLSYSIITTSIPFYSIALVSLISTKNQFSKTVLDVIHQASLVIRIYNDIRTYKKEKLSRSPNLIKITNSKNGQSETSSMQLITEIGKQEVKTFERMVYIYRENKEVISVRNYINYTIELYRSFDMDKYGMVGLLKIWNKSLKSSI